MLSWTSFRAFERGYAAEAPIRDIPRIGSAYKLKGYSSHPPNPLSILLIFYRDNHYRCSYLSESRTTTTVRSTNNIGACPVVPPTRAVTYKVNRLAYALKSSTFVLQGISRPRARTRPTMVSVCPAVPIQSLRGHRWVTRLLTFKNASRFRSLPTSTARRSHSRWCT